eukprot:m.390701 g.390701  ORF g.390701 m.390701 type:complete len:50 (+) comp209335_c0_seq1:66-215(+)
MNGRWVRVCEAHQCISEQGLLFAKIMSYTRATCKDKSSKGGVCAASDWL